MTSPQPRRTVDEESALSASNVDPAINRFDNNPTASEEERPSRKASRAAKAKERKLAKKAARMTARTSASTSVKKRAHTGERSVSKTKGRRHAVERRGHVSGNAAIGPQSTTLDGEDQSFDFDKNRAVAALTKLLQKHANHDDGLSLVGVMKRLADTHRANKQDVVTLLSGFYWAHQSVRIAARDVLGEQTVEELVTLLMKPFIGADPDSC